MNYLELEKETENQKFPEKYRTKINELIYK